MPVVRTGSLDIAYRDLGAGEPVLLINGTGESGDTWLPLVEPLLGRWRFLLLDQRDTGASSRADAAYGPRDLAADAAAALADARVEACHVGGFSLGGAVAQELAIAHPESVRSLFLLSTWAASDGWFTSQMRSWQSLRRAHADDETAFLRALEVWMFSPRTFEQRDVYERIYGMWDAAPGQDVDAWVRQCEADIAHDAAGRLPGVAAHTLVVVGADDICTPPRYAHELASLLPRARLEIVADAGHCALFERPDAVRALLEAWLLENASQDR